jgi:2-dehydropantoate 2-reductase
MLPSVTVVGAGSVGVFLGALFSRAARVTIIGRRPVPEAWAPGVRLEGARAGVFTPRFAGWDELPAEGPVFLATKAYQLPEALTALGGRAAGRVLWLCQNGLGILGLAARQVPGARLGRMTCWFGARLDAGVVRVAGVRSVELAGADARDRDELLALLAAAEMPAEAFADPAEIEWRKSLWNIAFNGVCAAAGVTNGVALDDPDLRSLADTLLEEAVLVARAEGTPVPPDYRERVHAGVRATASNLCSTLLDLRAGRPTELAWLNGEVVRRAEARGIAVPANRFIARLVSHLERAQIAASSLASR